MANIISEVNPDPGMKSTVVNEFDMFYLVNLENILDEDAIWVNFGVGGPA